MKKVLFCCLLICFISTGCTNMSEDIKKQRTKGIIDCCYTVTEHNPKDKETRIDSYLYKKIDQGVINNNEKFIIEQCLKRTENSTCWKAKEGVK